MSEIIVCGVFGVHDILIKKYKSKKSAHLSRSYVGGTWPQADSQHT